MKGERITSPADFPTVAVMRTAAPQGTVLTLLFRNREFGGLREILTSILAIAVLLVLVPLTVRIGFGFAKVGIPWFVAPLLTGLFYVWLYRRATHPSLYDREIEIDFGGDALRVLRNGSKVLERPLSALANVTVENHPDAEFDRTNRQERGIKTLRESEMSHCLVGWFGVGGAEQVILLTRAEWPDRRSLFEVQQALVWAKGQGGAADDGRGAPAPPPTIRPPLD